MQKRTEVNRESPEFRELLERIKRRDSQDASRKVSPTKPAQNAIQIDTTNGTEESVFSEALGRVYQILSSLSLPPRPAVEEI